MSWAEKEFAFADEGFSEHAFPRPMSDDGGMMEHRGQPFFDWNNVGALQRAIATPLLFDDETLRDGLQSPSVTNPSVEEKMLFLELAVEVGISAADIGLPGAGERVAADVEAVIRAINDSKLPIRPNCAARTRKEDIDPVLTIASRVGIPLEIMLFLSFSPIRRQVEGWNLDDLLARTEDTVKHAVTGGLPVTFVAEDATRTHPEDLKKLYLTAVRAGATRVCVADTAGHVTPHGAFQVVDFVRQTLADYGFAHIGIDWHGHNDRGMAVANAFAAALAGTERLHGTALGCGERVGNPAMEVLLANARLLGWADVRLDGLIEYAEHAAAMLGIGIPPGSPVVGRDAFRTSTGVHASAIRKAELQGDRTLQDLVYSSIPAIWLGRVQEIEIGPMSGASNVRFWLATRGLSWDQELIDRILDSAKSIERNLTDEEIHALVSNEAQEKSD